MTQFQARFSDAELLDIVRDVARVAAADDPCKVTQTAWDDGRALAGRSDAPRARSIAQRFGVPWERVLRIAAGRDGDRLRQLGNARADKGRKGVTLRRVVIAMRQAARALDVQGLDRTAYVTARTQIMQAASRTRSNDVAERSMPELTQIDTVLGQHDLTWQDATRLAKLDPPAARRRPSLDAAAAVAVFAEEFDAVPFAAHQLRVWARARAIPVTQLPAPAVRDAIDALQAQRSSDGLPALAVADAALTKRLVPGRTPSTESQPARRARTWNRASIITGLAIGIRMLDPGQRLDQRTLKTLAREHPDAGIPSWSSIDRCRRKHHPDETWADWVREAATLARTPGDL